MKKESPPTLGQMIDRLDEIRVELRNLTALADEVKKGYQQQEDLIKEELLKAGIDKAAGSKASVSLKRSLVGQIENYDAFCKYIKKTGYFHLLNRAVNAASFRELYATLKLSDEKFTARTGLCPFEKLSLNHSSLK